MEESFLPKYCHSIFHQLFLHASDRDSKLILLDQILELGDTKEIPLLERLEETECPKVSNKAYEVKHLLLERLSANPLENQRLPMNLCFIYEEFDIYPPKSATEMEVNFELLLEFLSDA